MPFGHTCHSPALTHLELLSGPLAVVEPPLLDMRRMHVYWEGSVSVMTDS